MIKGTIHFHDDTPALPIVIGTGEDVKAPRDLAALEKQGWVIDDNVTATYKAFLAAKRQGDVDSAVKFEAWIDNVKDVDLKPSEKQIQTAVALGKMDAEQGQALINLIREDSPE